jgi:hypothetical protein
MTWNQCSSFARTLPVRCSSFSVSPARLKSMLGQLCFYTASVNSRPARGQYKRCLGLLASFRYVKAALTDTCKQFTSAQTPECQQSLHSSQGSASVTSSASKLCFALRSAAWEIARDANISSFCILFFIVSRTSLASSAERASPPSTKLRMRTSRSTSASASTALSIQGFNSSEACSVAVAKKCCTKIRAASSRFTAKLSTFATSCSTSTPAASSCIKRNRGPLLASSESSVRRRGSNFFRGRSRVGRLYRCDQSCKTNSAQEFCAATLSSGGAVSALWMRSARTCAIQWVSSSSPSFSCAIRRFPRSITALERSRASIFIFN